MTQRELNRDTIMAILNGYIPIRKIGDWKEEGPQGGWDSGFIVEYETAPEGWPRFAQVSTAFLDEEEETARLIDGEEVWLQLSREDLQYRI